MRCLLINARSIVNKLPELHNLLYDKNPPDCIFITETWLNNNEPDGLLDPDGRYNIHRHDRTESRGGGVCILTNKKHRCLSNTVNQSNNTGYEHCSVDIVLNNHKVRFILLYRPPGNCHQSYLSVQRLCLELDKLINTNSPVIILGDLNCPSIDWDYSSPPHSETERTIQYFFQSNGYSQYVTQPTRGNNILDVVCTNCPTMIYNTSVSPPFGLSDHDTVTFNVSVQSNTCDDDAPLITYSTKNYRWSHANFDAIRHLLCSIKWTEIPQISLQILYGLNSAEFLTRSYHCTFQLSTPINQC